MSKRRTATTAAPAPVATATSKMPLPSGATRWSHIYLDTDGVPREAADPVPVDAHDRHTGHVLHACPHRGRIDDGTGNRAVVPCGMQQWVGDGETAPYCPDHGKKLIADGETERGPALPWSAMWRAIAPTARPFWFLAAQAAAGIVEHGWQVNPAWPAIGVPLLAAAGYAGARRVADRSDRDDTAKRRLARSGAYVGTAAGVWLTAAAAVDPSSVAGWVTWLSLPVAWAVAAAPWWRHLARRRQEARDAADREPIVVDEPAEPAEPEKTPEQIQAEAVAEQWATYSGIANTELLAGTVTSTPFGWQAVIKATKVGALIGATGDGKASTIKKVAACYDVPTKAVTWIDEYDDSPNRALLLVQPTNPLSDGRMWAHGDTVRTVQDRLDAVDQTVTVADDGGIVAEIGRFVDGSPMVETLYRPEWGPVPSITVGSTGGGKSMRLHRRLIQERWTTIPDQAAPGGRRGLYLSVLHDPKVELTPDYAGLMVIGTNRDHAHIIVDGLIREMERRYVLISSVKYTDRRGRNREGGVIWDPREHGPIISQHWDEFHTHANDKEFIAKFDLLLRKQRAVAMAAHLYTHRATYGDIGDGGVREISSSGRVTLLRTKDGYNASALAGARPVGDPRTLPEYPGMGFVVDDQDKGLVAAREDWLPNDKQAERMGCDSRYDWTHDDNNNPIGFPGLISPEMEEAFGPEFMALMAARNQDERDAVKYEPDEEIKSAILSPTSVAASGSSALSGMGDISTTDPKDALQAVLADGPLTGDQILNNSAWEGRGAATLMATASHGMEEGWLRRSNGVYELTGSVWPDEFGESHRDVLAALKEGYSSPKDIAERIGKSVPRVNQLLPELMAKGLVTKPDNKRGVYAAV